jgi:thiamine-phosphate pyrophosphorylase
MNLIVISHPENLKNELELVNALFEAGLNRFHLRKPNVQTAVLTDYLKKLNPVFLNRVVIHNNFELLCNFAVAGFHFKQQNIEWIKYKGLKHKSYSAHSFGEIIRLNSEKFDYIFLSPIFNSISKPGYTKGFEDKQLREFLFSGMATNPIVALGGLDEENIEKARNIGFSGVAVMGSLWNPLQKGGSVNQLVDKFLRMKKIWQPDLIH